MKKREFEVAVKRIHKKADKRNGKGHNRNEEESEKTRYKQEQSGNRQK